MAINRKRLRYLITRTAAAGAFVYGVVTIIPDYQAFAEEYTYRKAWQTNGWDDPAVRQRAYDSCMAGLRTTWPDMNSRSDIDQFDSLCSRPGVTLDNPTIKSWREIPLAFMKEQGKSVLMYTAAVVLLGPWLLGFLAVQWIPRLASGFRGWLTAPASPPAPAPEPSTEPASVAPVSSMETRDERLTRIARWSFVACAIILGLAGMIIGGRLVDGIDYSVEPMGFAALVFCVTFWIVQGNSSAQRRARREMYIAILYVLVGMDKVFFNFVL